MWSNQNQNLNSVTKVNLIFAIFITSYKMAFKYQTRKTEDNFYNLIFI